MTFHAGWNNYDPASRRVIETQARRIEELEKDLKTQLMDFLTFYQGDENNEMPDREGMEKVVDIYVTGKLSNT